MVARDPFPNPVSIIHLAMWLIKSKLKEFTLDSICKAKNCIKQEKDDDNANHCSNDTKQTKEESAYRHFHHLNLIRQLIYLAILFIIFFNRLAICPNELPVYPLFSDFGIQFFNFALEFRNGFGNKNKTDYLNDEHDNENFQASAPPMIILFFQKNTSDFLLFTHSYSLIVIRIY